jgi:hypothetical protein
MRSLRRTLGMAVAAVVAATTMVAASPAGPALASSVQIKAVTEHDGTCSGTYSVTKQSSGNYLIEVTFKTTSKTYGCTLEVHIGAAYVGVVAGPNTGLKIYDWYYAYDYVRLCQSGSPGKCSGPYS